MKIYVASKFENKYEVKELIKELEALGHTITKDWTLSTESSPQEAVEDYNGVINCDIYIGLFEDNLRYQGALVEFGIALANNKPIFILGDQLDGMIFMKMPGITKFRNRDQLLGAFIMRNEFRKE